MVSIPRSHWDHNWDKFKADGLYRWTLLRLAAKLSELYSQERIDDFVIVIWNTEIKGKEIHNEVIKRADFIIIDGYLVKDRSGVIISEGKR